MSHGTRTGCVQRNPPRPVRVPCATLGDGRIVFAPFNSSFLKLTNPVGIPASGPGFLIQARIPASGLRFGNTGEDSGINARTWAFGLGFRIPHAG